MTITDRNGRNLGADAGIGNNMLIQEVTAVARPGT